MEFSLANISIDGPGQQFDASTPDPLTYSQKTWFHTVGKRGYELTNHLGNVLSVISDKPIPHNNGSGTVDYFMADIRQSSDYSPFGVQLSNRNLLKTGVTNDYPMGYQGSLEDDEVKGDGNSYTTYFRMLDPRLGRWFSTDPVFQPHQSPYNSMDNSPIILNDVLGNYTEKRAKRMAERGAKHGYTTEVVESRIREGDFGVKYSKERTEGTYFKTQYWGTFRGIGKKGLRKGWHKPTIDVDEEGYGGGELSNEDLKNLTEPLEDEQSAVPGFALTGQTTGWYTPVSNTNGGIGVGSSILEKVPGSIRFGTSTRGFSPKYYPNAWGGNKYTTTFKIPKSAKLLGKATFVAGVIMDGYGVYEYYRDPNSPNAVHPAKAGLNTGIGIYGFYNPIAAGLYYGIDAFYPGGWKGLAEDQDRLDRENKAINPYWQLWPANKNM